MSQRSVSETFLKVQRAKLQPAAISTIDSEEDVLLRSASWAGAFHRDEHSVASWSHSVLLEGAPADGQALHKAAEHAGCPARQVLRPLTDSSSYVYVSPLVVTPVPRQTRMLGRCKEECNADAPIPAGVKGLLSISIALEEVVGRSAPVSSPSAPRLEMADRRNAFEGYVGQSQEKSQLAQVLSEEECARRLRPEMGCTLHSAWDDKLTSQRRAQDLVQLDKSTDPVSLDFDDPCQTLGRRSLLDALTAEIEHLLIRSGQLNRAMNALQVQLRLMHGAGVLRDCSVGCPS